METFSSLGGVEVHYDRESDKSYGKKSHASDWMGRSDFIEKLNRTFERLWKFTGVAEAILTAGVYVEKPGYHSRGRAFDLDGIVWTDKVFMGLDYYTDPIFYLGIESVLRYEFNTVLNYLYNKAHRDHWHIQDDGDNVFSKWSWSDVLFVQASINFVWGEELSIDGQYGPRTDSAVKRVLDMLSLSTIFTKGDWLQFLRHTTTKAFL